VKDPPADAAEGPGALQPATAHHDRGRARRAGRLSDPELSACQSAEIRPISSPYVKLLNMYWTFEPRAVRLPARCAASACRSKEGTTLRRLVDHGARATRRSCSPHRHADPLRPGRRSHGVGDVSPSSSRPGGEQRSPCAPPVAHGPVPSKGLSVVCGARGRDGSCPRASRPCAAPHGPTPKPHRSRS